MDVNQSSCSSEQQSQHHQQEEKDFIDPTSQKTGNDSREIAVNQDLLITETRHSMNMIDKSTHKTLQGSSSSMINEDNCPVYDIDKVARNSERSGDECFNSYIGDSLNSCSTTLLQDTSVVEFSLESEKCQDKINVMEEVLTHTVDYSQENILRCETDEKSENPAHTEESEDEPRQVHMKSTEVGPPETSVKDVTKEESNSSHLENEISMLLSRSALCRSSSDLGTKSGRSPIGRVDFSPTQKENLMRMLSDLLDECEWLKREKARLENEVDCLEADRSSLVYIAQVEVLEKSLAQENIQILGFPDNTAKWNFYDDDDYDGLNHGRKMDSRVKVDRYGSCTADSSYEKLEKVQADACSWEQKFQIAEQNYMAENVKIRTDLTTRLERVTRQYETANKDKEAMVIKYATSEREVIVSKKQKEALEKRMKDMEKERENLLSKNKMLISERARICQTLDTKVRVIE
ncbi:Coiled-coil domain-containing protein 186 [Chionoecetes opilio]|uniref:Coiled-coil domain-containing protein 186 n=1 Tax=Chionoecetes opilio TaxID=41210 RepID=A0A8J8WC84_CHIOP|nr:Coiled-coil domain-containing protein 186 [Chionoecetes opilio]